MPDIRDDRCTFTFNRIAPGVLEIVIDGIDNGQFGTAPLDEVSMALVRERPLELFVDATRASMPAVSVSKEWTRYFALNRIPTASCTTPGRRPRRAGRAAPPTR